MRKKYLCGIAGLLLALLLVGCGSATSPQDQREPLDQQNQPNQQDQQTEPPAVSHPSEMLVIETKYGYLYYPDRWNEYVTTTQEETSDAVTVCFEATVNGEKYPLFNIEVAEDSGSTEASGTITDTAGKVHDVFAHMLELEDTDALSEDELNRIYAMKESLNDLIENLK